MVIVRALTAGIESVTRGPDHQRNFLIIGREDVIFCRHTRAPINRHTLLPPIRYSYQHYERRVY